MTEVFSPYRRQPPASGTALVLRFAASEPAPGSVSPRAICRVPAAIPAAVSSAAWDPVRISASSDDESTISARLKSAHASSSIAMAYAISSAPWPPRCSGTVIASRPWSARSL